MKKLAILDLELNTFSVFSITEKDEEIVEDFLETLIENKVISGLGTIHWQVMDDLIIRNYTK